MKPLLYHTNTSLDTAIIEDGGGGTPIKRL